MKTINKFIKYTLSTLIICGFVSCNDYLNLEPESGITPENYFKEEAHLQAYVNNLYATVLPSHSAWSLGLYQDNNTDLMVGKTPSTKYLEGQYLTGSDGGWYFGNITTCNWFFDKVLPKKEENLIKGNAKNIDCYIGEMYFLRAWEYFKCYQDIGDYPIITEYLPSELSVLVEKSERAPRNEVARFILSDMDKALELIGDTQISRKRTRINKETILLAKSRVALFEGTWLKYFKDTPFVPNGPNWPGKEKAYNANYEYPTGSIDAEIDYFLSIAMEASKQIADIIELTENTGHVQQAESEPVNPYMNMFSDVDLSSYDEVLLYRQYDYGLNISHNVVVSTQLGGTGCGFTRGAVDGFLMSNGLPIYAENSGYKGDKTIMDVRKERDSRLSIFLKEPGQKNVLIFNPVGDHANIVESYPDITEGDWGKSFPTGYATRKGNNYDQIHAGNGTAFTAAVSFRGAEALLNYIEACYEKNGSLDKDAQLYWRKLRTRANVDADFNKTIAATNMLEEAKLDWGAYSAGKLIDPTLYNIRRERKSEFLAESLRTMDLKRWRSMDQLIETPFHIEGFRLWGPMQDWYTDSNGKSILKYGMDDDESNVSEPSTSEYLRPFQITNKSLAKNGLTWKMAHYLVPIGYKHFTLTSQGSDVSSSPIYQNPYWDVLPNEPALK